MEQTDLLRCASLLTAWYATCARPFPWRTDASPYRVWISEIMLQQTRIEAAMPYYDRFLRELPDVAALAAVSEEKLLKLWQGLGYYSRARHLKEAAVRLTEQYGGELPADYDALCSLPGIGSYTAGAIASIAFGIPVPAVDGNVMRVLSRLTEDATNTLSAPAKEHFAAVVRQMIPPDEPGAFNQALMELGETVCLPGGVPDCGRCPLAEECRAHRNGTVGEYPVREAKKGRRKERRQVAVVIADGCVLLHKRPDKGLLSGLWELPNALSSQLDGWLPESVLASLSEERPLPTGRHIFSHVEWEMTGRLFSAEKAELPAGYVWAAPEDVEERYALPSAFRTYVSLLPELLCKGD